MFLLSPMATSFLWAQPMRLVEELSQKGVIVEQLLLSIQRIQLKWFRDLTRMPTGHLLGEVFQAYPNRETPQGKHRTC